MSTETRKSKVKGQKSVIPGTTVRVSPTLDFGLWTLDIRSQRGVTLIELVISIVVISVAMAGVLLVMNQTTRHSADPMIEHQAVAVAEAYLEEALLKSFADPSLPPNPDAGRVCPGPEGARSQYDNVCDYNGLDDNGARDQLGNAVAGLGGYRVRVGVDCASALHDIPGNANCDATNVVRVNVRVTHSSMVDLTVSGYRTRYQ